MHGETIGVSSRSTEKSLVSPVTNRWALALLWGGEGDLGHFPRGLGGFEVGVVALEAGPGCEHAVGPLADVGVVGLQGIIVTLACDGDAVFGAGQFVLKAQEVFVRLELGIILDDEEQAA